MKEIKVYIRSSEKVYIHADGELLFYEGKDLQTIIERIKEEYEVEGRITVLLIVHFSYFLLDEDIKGSRISVMNNIKFLKKRYYLNHIENKYMDIYLEKKYLNEIKKTFRKYGFEIYMLIPDFIALYNAHKDNDMELLQVGEESSIRTVIENGKISEIERLELKLDDMEDIHNFDFGNMETVLCREEDIEKIFSNNEYDEVENFVSIKYAVSFSELKNIGIKDVLAVMALILVYILIKEQIPLKEQAAKNKSIREETKKIEAQYLKEKGEKLPDYKEELSKLSEIDESIKRKEYYSFIKFLVDNSSYGVGYTKISYEKGKWVIQGEISDFNNFEKFEASLQKKFSETELGYIKDNDEITVFEYTVMQY